MDGDALTRHMELVRELSKQGHALDRFAPTATKNNRRWWRLDGKPTKARARLHKKLIADAFAQSPGVKQERKAIVFAGPPGAGKSSLRRELLQEKEGDYLVIDADDFKKALMKQALADGSYESFIKPDAIRELEAAGAQFFPLELSSLVHEESSYLAKRLRRRAMANGDNIVIDSVLSSQEDAAKLSAELVAAGYEVQVIDLEVPYEFSQQKIRERWAEARRDALSGGDPLGGRWVPSDYARYVFDGPNGVPRPEAVARWLAEHCPLVKQYRLFRKKMEQVNQPHAVPTLETEMTRATPGGPLTEATGKRDASDAKRTTPGPTLNTATTKKPKPNELRIRPARGGTPSLGSQKDGRTHQTVGTAKQQGISNLSSTKQPAPSHSTHLMV